MLCMSASAFAAENDYILSGTWRFHDVITQSEPFDTESLNFTFTVTIPTDNYADVNTFVASGTGIYQEPMTPDGFAGSVRYLYLDANGTSTAKYFYHGSDAFWQTHYLGLSKEAVEALLQETYGYVDPHLVELAYSCYGEGIKIITFDSAQEVSKNFYDWFTSNADPVDITLPVTDTLPVVLGWVGSVVSSLFSGELSGLLILVAIPVAIVIVFLGARLLRRLWWGA